MEYGKASNFLLVFHSKGRVVMLHEGMRELGRKGRTPLGCREAYYTSVLPY